MPKEATALIQQWQDTIRVADEKTADTSSYYDCMDAAKIPLLTRTGLPAADLDEAISSLDPASKDIPSSASDPAAQSKGWQKL